MVQQRTNTLPEIPTTNLLLGDLTKTRKMPSLKNGEDPTTMPSNVVPE